MTKIMIAGDYVPQKRIVNLIALDQYETIFREVTPLIREADFSIVNFECPVASV